MCRSSCVSRVGSPPIRVIPVAGRGGDVADGEGAGDRKAEPISLAEDQPARAAPEMCAADRADSQSEQRRQVDDVADQAEPLPRGLRARRGQGRGQPRADGAGRVGESAAAGSFRRSTSLDEWIPSANLILRCCPRSRGLVVDE